MPTLFISDLHLDLEHPEVIECFLRFLSSDATKADALYILGDLFEVWVGDDEENELTLKVMRGIQGLRQQGVPVFYMHGNRDFLVGSTYSDACGWHLLTDPTRIDLYGTPTLLLHGDTLCTQDLQYQAFKRQVRDPVFQQTFLQKPLAERKEIAAHIRATSEQYTKGAAAEIMDVSLEEVSKVMRHYQVQQMIHGHTHRPAIHPFTLAGLAAKRIVLGAWHKKGHALNYQANQDPFYFELDFK